jgi:hypothetical protein
MRILSSNKQLFAGVNLILVVFLCLGSNVGMARVLFEQNFESGAIDTSPSPVWAWKAPISTGNVSTGMMFGDADVYSVTSAMSHSGERSMRLNFAGRNQWCDVCGSAEVIVTQNDVNAGCVAITGSPWGDSIYNKTNGFSKWEVTSSDSSQVCFNSSVPEEHSMFGQGSSGISAGDAIAVPFKCGVNGNVGNDIARHSDCNKAINYLDNVSSSDHGYGQVLSRRFHLYIPSITKLPEVTLKLGYTHWKTGSGPTRSVKLKLSVQRGLQLELNMPNSQNAVPKIYMEKDTWYYYEELFVRESSEGAGDAEYHLYFGKPGDDVATPVVFQNGFNIGKLIDVSMHGNWQHFQNLSGSIYFDDILISNEYVGPAPAGDNVYSKANPPGSFTGVVQQNNN